MPPAGDLGNRDPPGRSEVRDILRLRRALPGSGDPIAAGRDPQAGRGVKEMLPTIYDEIAWDRFLDKICAGCKTVEKNNGFCPYEGQEGDCKKVAKKLVENRKED